MSKFAISLITLATVAVLLPSMAYVFTELCELRAVWFWRDMLGLEWGLHCK